MDSRQLNDKEYQEIWNIVRDKNKGGELYKVENYLIHRRELINNIDPNNQLSGDTILHYLAKYAPSSESDYDICMRNLIAYGANPFLKNKDNQSAYEISHTNPLIQDAIYNGIRDAENKKTITEDERIVYFSWREHIILKQKDRKYADPLPHPTTQQKEYDKQRISKSFHLHQSKDSLNRKSSYQNGLFQNLFNRKESRSKIITPSSERGAKLSK